MTHHPVFIVISHTKQISRYYYFFQYFSFFCCLYAEKYSVQVVLYLFWFLNEDAEMTIFFFLTFFSLRI